MLIRRILNHERFEAEKVSNICFSFTNQADKDKQAFLDRMRKDDEDWNPDEEDRDCYAAFIGGVMAGIVETPRFTVNFDGGTVPMRGLGNVCAMPAYRKQGVVRALIETALRDMYSDGAAFSYLYPFSYDFYRKLGYEAAMTVTTYEAEISACPKYDGGGTVKLCESREDFEEAAGVYKIFSGRANMSSVRDGERWDEEFGQKPSQCGVSTYLWTDGSGNPRSYMTYEIDRRGPYDLSLNVRELCFADMEALRALIGFARSFEGFYNHITLPVPDGIDMRFLFTEHTRVSGSVRAKGMARIIDARKAFEAARARGSGTVHIETRDVQIPENSGVWRIDFTPGGVSAEKADAPADLSAPIHALSALLIGVMDFERADFYPDIAVRGNREALAKLFYRKVNWNNERF